jgi:altronate dehydratase
MGIELDDNRSIGNEEGGLTTIYEKSLGAIAKGGNTPLNGVFDYAQKVDLYERMREDMDINAGAVLDGRSMDVVAEQLFDLVIAVASGQPSKSEEQGVGESEFVPWSISGPL